VTTDGVLAGCPRGPATGAYAARLVRAAGLSPDPAAGNHPGRVLAAWLVDLMLGQVEASDGVWLWADLARENWESWALPWLGQQAHDGRRTGAVASLTSGRYLSLTAAPLFDLVGGVVVAPTLPDNWLETRVFNLRTLYAICREQADKWTAQPPPGPTPTPSPSPS
jgi:hypothetical protein